MKIKLIVVLRLISFSLFAQNGPPPPPPDEGNMPDTWGARYFHFGLNFTPGIYWLSPNTSNNTVNGASFGYGYGANLEFYFTRNYGFLLGFEVTQIGAKYINDNPNPRPLITDSTVTHNETIQYLQLPLELKLKTDPFGNFRFYGVVGLNFGFRLKATDDNYTVVSPYTGWLNIPYSGSNVDISSSTDFFRVSLVFGLGTEYQLAGSTALQTSITYNNCFTNLNNTSSNAVNSKGIELMVGILF